jgi:carbonic anhydrase
MHFLWVSIINTLFMLKINHLSFYTISFFVLFSCNNPSLVKPKNSSPTINDKVMTPEEQKLLTADSVIKILKNGNEHFYENKLTLKNDSLRIHLTASGQYPMAAILSCADSRVPVEEVFDKGIGDLFVTRVAGNVADVDILGSLEYACRVSGVKVIMVLGHEHCGAIKAAIDGVKTGNLTPLMAEIEPAVDSVKISGKKTSKNDWLVHAVAIKNIQLTIKKILANSELLKNLEQKNAIKILGGIYNLDSGRITFINPGN